MNTHSPVIVIGAGITGIGAAYYLGKHNFSYTILEAKQDLGGVWHTQRWHGARCDSDIIKYSFSFKPFLSDQCVRDRADIQQYLWSVVNEFRIRDNIQFDASVTKASFDTHTHRWTIETNRGVFTSQFLFNGNGYFADRPFVPNFTDVDQFGGEVVHASNLDASRTFHDKRVVLVGSGSTAISCAPQLSLVSKSLVMLQRSPSYIYEIDNKLSGVTVLCQNLYRRGFKFPVAALRQCLQAKDDLIFVGFRRFPRIAKWFFRRHWIKAVGPETVNEHFSPRYNPWEQRIPIAIGLKEKIRSGKIVLKTDEIDRFTPIGILLKRGEFIACDVVVLATGFSLQFLKFALVIDNHPVSIDRLNFYKGFMLGSIPNYFQPVGVWHSAWTQRSEGVTRFAIKIMRYMKEQNFGTVQIERKDVPHLPSITPNYIRRHPEVPRLYGSFELPALDQLFSYRFRPREFRFS